MSWPAVGAGPLRGLEDGQRPALLLQTGSPSEPTASPFPIFDALVDLLLVSGR